MQNDFIPWLVALVVLSAAVMMYWTPALPVAERLSVLVDRR
jgi:hypothetical protein